MWKAFLAAIVVYVTSATIQGQWSLEPLPPPPIAESGLRVMVVYESDPGDFQLYTADEQAAVNATAPGSFRGFCNDHCAKGPDGVTPDAIFLDDDHPELDLLPDYWREAWQRRPREAAQGLPWLVASNGKTGYEGPLPDAANEQLAILEDLVD